jgi:uncharacterized membrane protein YqjE
MTSMSRGPGTSRFPLSPPWIVVLVVVLVVVTLVWPSYQLAATISAVAACGQLAEGVCGWLRWLQQPRST